MNKIIILVSDYTKYLDSIISESKNTEIVGLISNSIIEHPETYSNIKHLISYNKLEFKLDDELEFLKQEIEKILIQEPNIKCIVLSKFNSILSTEFLDFFRKKRIPIIDSFVSHKYKNNPEKSILENNDDVITVSIHILEPDTIINQRFLEVSDIETIDSIKSRSEEYLLHFYPEVLDNLHIYIRKF